MKSLRQYVQVMDLKIYALLIVFSLSLITTQYSWAQQNENFKEFKGVVMNGNTKKSLEFATLSVSNTNISSVSNVDGQFSLKVPLDKLGELVIWDIIIW